MVARRYGEVSTEAKSLFAPLVSLWIVQDKVLSLGTSSSFDDYLRDQSRPETLAVVKSIS